MNIFDIILWPFKLAVSAVLWFFHTIFTSIGMDPSSGFTCNGAVHYLFDPCDACRNYSSVCAPN